MIARHILMKSVKKSDFAGLLRYLTDTQEKNERVGEVTVTNCQNDTIDAALLEILNTQAQNCRAKSDKTYHLVISFAPGESPDSSVLKAIEDKICRGLGYGEHQRVSVVHHDTDNLHVQVAINKIHPARHTIHEPYNDYRTLGALCESLELEYGLKYCNHQARKRGGENLAEDMEHHAGVESLLGWIKRECHGQIQAAQSWEALHEIMRENGLVLHERGNGLVFTSEDGITVKASSVDRAFSKKNMEARLGRFEPSLASGDAHPPKRKYEKRPMRSRVDTTLLYARYRAEQTDVQSQRALAWGKVRERKDRLIKAAKRRGRLKRAAIKLVGAARLEKKAMYALTSRSLVNDIARINELYFRERQAIYDKHRRRAWADWLRAQAVAGDEEALAALRARGAAHPLQGDTLTGRCRVAAPGVLPEQDGVTKKGTIIYRAGATALRDDGDRLQVSHGATQEGLQAALRIAMRLYGTNIRVDGTDAFKEQIALAAVGARLAIHFDAAGLEARRQELLQQATAKEHDHDRPNGRRTAGGRPVGGEPGATGSTRPAGAGRPGAETAATRAARPDAGGIGQAPPPASRHRLRGLSELGVVHIPSGTEVLLPGDVPRHLEQQGTAATDVLRRRLPGVGMDNAALAAADRYVFEREQKRCNGFDIPKHGRYDGYVGSAVFAGIRMVDEQALALLKLGRDIMVVPVDDVTARRLKRLSLGQDIAINRDGRIRKKGRTR